jgi:rhamnosyl/mannosyltransferase
LEEQAPKFRLIIAKYHRPIVLSVGRLVYYKGFEYLIRAMAAIKGSLIIIGNGPLKAELLRLASRVGISERLTILDQVEDVTPFYHAADLFVLPSIARTEAFGIVQLEAMAAGKPVINTQLHSGVPFVSQHGITGLTVPPADTAALARAINRLLGDPALRASYGAAARLRTQEEFTVDRMVARTLAIYHHVITAPDQPITHARNQTLTAALDS